MAIESLPVIFRKEKYSFEEGYDIVAVFPTLPGYSAINFQAYVPISKGWTFPSGYTLTTVSPEWYQGTKPAAPEEYTPLLQYLQTLEGFEHLKVYQRMQYRFIEDRRDELNRIYAG